MRLFFTSLAFLLISFSLFSQNTSDAAINPEQKKLDALKGTYEIRRSAREMPLLPSNLADIISANRKENELNVVKLNETTKLLIFPMIQIRNASLKTKSSEDHGK